MHRYPTEANCKIRLTACIPNRSHISVRYSKIVIERTNLFTLYSCSEESKKKHWQQLWIRAKKKKIPNSKHPRSDRKKCVPILFILGWRREQQVRWFVGDCHFLASKLHAQTPRHQNHRTAVWYIMNNHTGTSWNIISEAASFIFFDCLSLA